MAVLMLNPENNVFYGCYSFDFFPNTHTNGVFIGLLCSSDFCHLISGGNEGILVRVRSTGWKLFSTGDHSSRRGLSFRKIYNKRLSGNLKKQHKMLIFCSDFYIIICIFFSKGRED